MTAAFRLFMLIAALLLPASAVSAQDLESDVPELSATREASGDFQAINSLCTQKLKLLGGRNKALQTRLAKLRKAAAQLDGGGDEQEPPTPPSPDTGSNASNGGAGPVSGEAQSPTKFINSVEDHFRISKQLAEAARRSVALAERETSPAAKQRLYRDATRKIKKANFYSNRAVYAVERATGGSAPQQREGLRLGKFPLLKQAQKVLNRSGRAGWEDALKQRRTESQPPPKDAGTPFFEQKQELIYDADGERIILEGGDKIDLSPLHRAVEEAQPGAPRRKLFETVVPAPSGVVPSVEPTSFLIDVLSDPKVWARAREVGGVRLEVTFDALALAGVNGLEGGGALQRIDRPVLISLRRLHEAARDHANSWAKLPSQLRYPGGVSRVHGFVLTSDRSDIILVGAAAQNPLNRIDIDSVILTLRFVWQKGLWPQVSLDPMPDRLEGPQYSRIENLPTDSVPARILINADYAMKEIMHGRRTLGDTDFSPMSRRLSASTTGGYLSRFWFEPKPLSPGTVNVSESGRSVLFETGVGLQTEALTVANGNFQGTGSANAMAEEAARQFTRLYPIMQLRQDIQPTGVFIRLQGLVDLASLASILRRARIGKELLDGFSAFPHRRLEGPEAVPRYFPAVSVPLEDGSGLRLSGGIALIARASTRSIGSFGQRMSETLERAVDGFADNNRISRVVDLSLTLPEQEDSRPPQLVRAVLDGQRAMAAGDFVAAASALRQAAVLDPFDVKVWIGLAAAEVRASRHADAKNALESAQRLDPDDPSIDLARLDVDWISDSARFLTEKDREDIVLLSQEYAKLAYNLILSGNARTAVQYGTWSIELWRNNGLGHLALFWADKDRTSRNARRALIQAIRIFRGDLRRGEDGAAEALAYVLALSAMQRLPRAQVYLEPGGIQSTGDYFILRNELSRVIEEAREASSLDEELPLGPALEAQAMAFRAKISGAGKEVTSLQRALDQATMTVNRYPDFSFGWYVRATVRQLMGDLPAALADANHAVELEPSAENYAYRAGLGALLGNCEGARKDFELARRRSAGFAAPNTKAAIRDACN